MCQVSKKKITNNNNTNTNNSHNVNNLHNTNNANQIQQANQIQNIQQQNNISLIDFGNEDISKLTDEEILSSLNSTTKAFVNFCRLIHANERLPQYSNVFYRNLRSKFINVLEDSKVVSKDRNQIKHITL